MKMFDITQNGREANIFIYGDITSYPYKANKSAASIVEELQALDADVINVHIDSYGGSVKEGWGMYNALREHKAKIRTYADGFVASAALYPFLAGDERYASSVSAFFLHQVAVGAHGYAEDLRAAADDADLMTDIGIQAFVDVAGMTKEKTLELMKQETWLKPQTALELGICTAITKGGESQTYTQSVRQQIIQKLTGMPEEQKAPGEPVKTNIFAAMFATK